MMPIERSLFPTLLAEVEPIYASSPKPAQELTLLDKSILSSLSYRDQFDWPMTTTEIHRYLHGVSASLKAVEAALQDHQPLSRFIVRDRSYFALKGRSEIFATRRRRAETAARLWPVARKLGQILWHLPFVRMVAVTGSLAADNPDVMADIDFMLLTDPGKMWRVRALSKLLQVFDRWFGSKTLCVNYHLSMKALVLEDRRLYSAQEFAQMVPLFGQEAYLAYRQANPWVLKYLPNAASAPPGLDCQERVAWPWLRAVAEACSGWPIGEWVDHFERRRKMHKYNHTDWLEGQWTTFTEEASGHRINVADSLEKAWQNRLHHLGVDMEFRS